MSMTCSHCGVVTTESFSFCPECGTASTAARKNETGPTPLRPYRWENLPPPAAETHALVPQPPHEYIHPEPVGLVSSGEIVPARPSVPEKPRRAGRVVVIVTTAVLVVGAGITGWVVRGSNTPPPPNPVVQVVPDNPGKQCSIIDMGNLPSSFDLGNDHLQTPHGFANPDTGIQVCQQSTDTSLDATYAFPQNDWPYVRTPYVWLLQTLSGFTPARMTDSGGYLWGKSVDAGKWLLIKVSNDPDTGVEVNIQKGGTEILPDWLAADILNKDNTTQDALPPAKPPLTPAQGWNPYGLQGWELYEGTPSLGMRYNKIVNGSLVGTMATYGMNLSDYAPLGPFNLENTAQGVFSTYQDRDPSVANTEPVKTTVAGCDAVQYTFTRYGQTVRVVLVQGPTAVFTFTAQVDASDPALLDEVQRMIDSAEIT